MTTRISRWFLTVGLGLSAAALGGACGSDPVRTKIDTDGDGYFDSQDCDDDNAKVSPSAFENCTDGKDNDCDGKVDAADFECGAPTGSSGGVGGAGGGGGQGGAGGVGGCAQTCADAVHNGIPMCPEADPASITKYNAMLTCACGSDPVNSKCTAVCSDEFCPTVNTNNIQPDSACYTCMTDPAQCGSPVLTCEMDM